MKKLLTLLTLVLTLTFCFSSTALASNLGDDYNGGGEDGKEVGTQSGVYEGITSARSGYLIWLSDGSGRAINGVVACATAELPAEEKAIFILLEREKEIAPVVLNQEAIRAHD